MLTKLLRLLRRVNFRPSPADFLLGAIVAIVVLALEHIIQGAMK